MYHAGCGSGLLFWEDTTTTTLVLHSSCSLYSVWVWSCCIQGSHIQGICSLVFPLCPQHPDDAWQADTASLSGTFPILPGISLRQYSVFCRWMQGGRDLRLRRLKEDQPFCIEHPILISVYSHISRQTGAWEEASFSRVVGLVVRCQPTLH